MRCGRRTTTAGSALYWLGNLRRRHFSVLATRTMVASASKRSLRNPWIPMARLMNCLMHLDRRKRRRERPQFLPWASLRRCIDYLPMLTWSLESEGQFELWGMQGLPIISDIPIIYLVFLLQLHWHLYCFSPQLGFKMLHLSQRFASLYYTSWC